ncbi:putative bifunctional diguanylate cyclase/phosphodiesterase [Herbaspirillum rhizosphaerae]|uniref:putative bifunctional diguanylate cyclase/phosphodiesterase n=1 Tax=Herbaspirillum rhizosphaerae TaxID=346179 RepID=UPI00067C541B|nr:bifunctional diguanylate cyclase/phosphodiesterase [Herbaspirillum rhizosphaerae]
MTPLLKEKIPSLNGLADFESALLRYQLALNKYFARSISRDRFLLIERDARMEMDMRFGYLLNRLQTPDDMQAIRQSYASVLALGPKFEAEMMRPAVNAEAARVILRDLNTNTNNIRTQLDRLQGRLESTSVDGASDVVKEVNDSSSLVHLYTAASLLIALFLIYQFRARLASERKLAFQAWHDPLTQLPHRLAFEQRLTRLDDKPYTVVLCVPDRFDQIVGGIGHRRADRLILEMTRRVQEVARRHAGEVFRMDGANIAILYRLSNGHPDFYAALDALKALGTSPFQLENQEMHVTLSLGASEYPIHSADPADLLKNADAALTAAREAGGDTYVFYSQSLNERSQEKLALEAALGHAVEQGELELHYQPQYDVANARLIGFEALVRWRRDGQLVSPADFIPVAESSGLIVPIGSWILQEACRQIKIWNEGADEKLLMAINISPRQFNHPGFMLMVHESLTQSGVDPSWIELEITEGIMVQRPERTALLMKHLRHLGIQLAIDDFGTGYSSLSYLKHFPITKLKIDQSFIRGLQAGSSDAAIVQAVITLGHNLNVAVIAEGVEEQEHLDLLGAWRCDQIQGYFYSKPLTANRAGEFISRAGEFIARQSLLRDASAIELSAA